MPPDLYATLGLARTATAAEVKQAYRRLSMEWHPDVNPAPDAPARFAAISAAYATLSNPARRAAYDRLGAGHASRSPHAQTPPDLDHTVARQAALARQQQRARLVLSAGLFVLVPAGLFGLGLVLLLVYGTGRWLWAGVQGNVLGLAFGLVSATALAWVAWRAFKRSG